VTSSRDVDVVVIGAGQAGLSTARSLARQGFAPQTGFVVLDADERPGGAWQHRWPSLTVGTTHRVHDLPPFAVGVRESVTRQLAAGWTGGR
jgi:cation diffusion facilitator CzcD-associated flavoprotein CzcO